MSEHSAFKKLHVDEREKADLGGVLEQLNLPPVFVEFVKKYQKIITITLSVIAIAVVVWALYGSYVEKKTAESSRALYEAQQLGGNERIAALEGVVSDYSGTDASRWAQIALARHSLDAGEHERALGLFLQVRESLSSTNSLYSLVTFGMAQAYELMQNYEKALVEYSFLKNIGGYEGIGYTGAARIEEIRGNNQKAVNEYEQYLGTLNNGGQQESERSYILEKIRRLKALP